MDTLNATSPENGTLPEHVWQQLVEVTPTGRLIWQSEKDSTDNPEIYADSLRRVLIQTHKLVTFS